MQGSDFIPTNKCQKEYGGSLLLGKRKGRRALSTKHAIHLTFKVRFARRVQSRKSTARKTDSKHS